MTDFRVVISDPKTGKSYQVEVTGDQANRFIGKKIGDHIEGNTTGLPGYKLKITGGTDKDGFPMRPDLPGAKRRKLLISKSTGFKPREKGLRRRKTLRGRDISSDISQINLVITEYGTKTLEELFTPPEEPEDTSEE